MTRAWVYSQMTGSAGLTALVGNRIYQSKSLREVPQVKPYVMYRFLSNTSVLRGDDNEGVRNQSFMVMAHDVPGTYENLDLVLYQVKLLFQNSFSKADGVIHCRWIDDSEDFIDEDMGTIVKWSRFHIKFKE